MTEPLIIRDPRHDFEIRLAPPTERARPRSRLESCITWVDKKLKALDGVKEIKLEVPHYTLSVMRNGSYQRGCYITAIDLDELCEPTTTTVVKSK